MPYSEQIVAMARRLRDELEANPQLHENRFYMLWCAILQHHFPITSDYGLAPQTLSTGTGTRPEYLILKLRDEEHLVVVELKKAAEETDAGMERVEVELLEYIEDRFSKTRYPTIYGIGGIGFSWTVLKVDRAGSNRPTIIVPWRGHVTSNRSYLLLKNVADEIHAMSAQVHQ
jgi:hypothetical protein